jgi:hypothetical protein
MKRIGKISLTVFLIACCLILLASCGGGIGGDEAKQWVRDFFVAIEEEDYELAESYLHPERPADMEEWFLFVEEEKELDFQKGIEIQYEEFVSSAYYDSTVSGSTYELGIEVRVGEKTAYILIELVKNENGFGIYNFQLNT